MSAFLEEIRRAACDVNPEELFRGPSYHSRVGHVYLFLLRPKIDAPDSPSESYIN